MYRKRPKTGFSLIELMAALLIFTTSLLFIFAMFPTAFKAIGKARYILHSTEIARKDLEYAKGLDFNTLDPEVNTDGIPDRTTTLVSKTNGATSSVTYYSTIVPTVLTRDDKDTGSPQRATQIHINVQVKYGMDGSDVKTTGASLQTIVADP